MSVVANALLYASLGVLVFFYLSPIFPEKCGHLICPVTGEVPPSTHMDDYGVRT